jgi:hypothetical protein
MTTDPRRPAMEAVNSRLLILPFCMDAIVHKHAVTLRQLPGNIFDVGQSSSLEHYRSRSRVLRKAHFLSPLSDNADRFNAFKKRIDVYQSLWRLSASYVDRILRGANPADLPLQVPTKYETVWRRKRKAQAVA